MYESTESGSEKPEDCMLGVTGPQELVPVIYDRIMDGAITSLKVEYLICLIFCVIFSVIIFFFILRAGGSMFGFNTAFRGGSVMGFALFSIGVFVL